MQDHPPGRDIPVLYLCQYTTVGVIYLMCFLVTYVIVIAQVPGLYGSKQTESEGVARG